eukprot:3539029-Amphidinium_carterae.3
MASFRSASPSARRFSFCFTNFSTSTASLSSLASILLRRLPSLSISPTILARQCSACALGGSPTRAESHPAHPGV